MGKWKQWGFSWCLHYKIWAKFLEKTNLLAFSEVERLNERHEWNALSRAGFCSSNKHEWNHLEDWICGVSPLQPVLELSAQEIGQTYCRKFLDFLVATVYFPSTQPTVGVRNPPVPNPIHLSNPPCGTKSLGSFVYLTSTKHRKRCLVTGHFWTFTSVGGP